MQNTETRVRRGIVPAYFLGRPTSVYIDRYLMRGRRRQLSTRS